MSATKNHRVLWGMLIVFIGLNIWLLYGKANLQQQVNRLQAQALQKEEDIAQVTEPVEFTGSDFQKPLRLVAVFTDYGCTSCVVTEIEYLSKWNKKYSNTLKAYYLGETAGYLEQFGAKFSYEKIESVNNLFTISLPVGNPVIALVDANGNVQSIHTNDLSRPGSDQRRENFYQRMNSLFQLVYGQ
jgi:hypothetical protein